MVAAVVGILLVQPRQAGCAAGEHRQPDDPFEDVRDDSGHAEPRAESGGEKKNGECLSRDGNGTERKGDLDARGECEERGPEHDERDAPQRAFRDEREGDRTNAGAVGGERGGLEEATATPHREAPSSRRP
jgi:hypothetical protein